MATKDDSTRTGSQQSNQARQHGRAEEQIGQKRADKDLRPGEAGELDVVEEKLEVGKRAVEKGGVRVHRTVEERPVEEKVNLREEHVNVERRPVDRPVTAADQHAFKEGTIEVTETREEPVVAKTARIVEEVVVNKDVSERTETVRDNVRRSDVQVEQLGEGHASQAGMRRFDEFDGDFRQNFQQSQFAKQYQYDQVSPAYRYGYDLACDRANANGDWNTIETNARTRWEQRNPGTWERFKDSIKYAFEKVRPGHSR